nr:hypothetical protein [Helicobacter kayseriensis]
MLDFSQCSCLEEKINLAYTVFKNDFSETQCFLRDIFIDIKNRQKIKIENMEVEEVFWHIISRKNNGKREFDILRAERIGWIKAIFLNYNNVRLVKLFYFFEKTGQIRLYLWLYQYDFVVILEKIITSSKKAFIVTSFYIDNLKKKNSFQKKYIDYIAKNDKRLINCEWF